MMAQIAATVKNSLTAIHASVDMHDTRWNCIKHIFPNVVDVIDCKAEHYK